jgi:hypothetical protein
VEIEEGNPVQSTKKSRRRTTTAPAESLVIWTTKSSVVWLGKEVATAAPLTQILLLSVGLAPQLLVTPRIAKAGWTPNDKEKMVEEE